MPPDNRPLVAPIYQSVKFSSTTSAETLRYLAGQREGFYYSRVSNPTLRQLELALAELQGRDACLLTGSGVAAIAIALLGAAQGRATTWCTSPSCTRRRARWCASCSAATASRARCCPSTDTAGLERVLAATPTRLVVFESPTNPVLKVADIARDHGARAGPRRADAARQHARRPAQPRRVRRGPVRAQPDQVRLRPRRRDGRRGDRARAS